MTGRFVDCDSHQRSRAAWRCEACARNLCEDCAAAVPAGRGEIVACAFCGGLISPILVSRAVAWPFRTQIRCAISRALSPKALALAAIVTCASQCLTWAGPEGWVFGNLLALAWALLCMRLAAAGRPPFGRPTYAELGAALTGPLLRLAVSAGILGLAALWLAGGGRRSAPLLPGLLVAALAVAVLPPALVDAAVERPDHRWLFPWSLPEMEKRIGSDIRPIRLAAVPFAAFALLEGILPPPDFRLDADLAAHLATSAACRLGWVLALALMATLAGALVFARAEELSHGEPERHRVPAVPGATPRGSRAPRP